jgi:ssDNA-binding Zn-finger/Zn-ribbon topoisomerase 1
VARQTKTKSEKATKTCSLCGARMWLWDEHRHRWIGPYHFQDCTTVTGGDIIAEENIRDKMQWDTEEYVPREKGRELLRMILDMNKKLSEDREEREKPLAKRKAIIHEEIDVAGVPF